MGEKNNVKKQNIHMERVGELNEIQMATWEYVSEKKLV